MRGEGRVAGGWGMGVVEGGEGAGGGVDEGGGGGLGVS